MAFSTELRFTSTDGLPIKCVRWDSSGPVRGVVQIAHGMGEHIGRYVSLINALALAGLTVYGNDHRGHGRTAPSPAHFGDFGEGGFDIHSIAHDFYAGGRHEMLNEISRDEVRARLLAWIAAVLERRAGWSETSSAA